MFSPPGDAGQLHLRFPPQQCLQTVVASSPLASWFVICFCLLLLTLICYCYCLWFVIWLLFIVIDPDLLLLLLLICYLIIVYCYLSWFVIVIAHDLLLFIVIAQVNHSLLEVFMFSGQLFLTHWNWTSRSIITNRRSRSRWAKWISIWGPATWPEP